ncbi:TRAP transporter small permease [Brevibacterium aurantiacum]|uniref:TRAP transporter small permease n=1 Tax=Brevibacterium aurantiacum TaxID=273384 RepID=A0A4Z0KET8_BREAU|nr:TRAP transporter small permease [Brevibacterium aurantiacum]TGD37065.1 TRAP transporter small permease [Brevibacterium aurantiacum]
MSDSDQNPMLLRLNRSGQARRTSFGYETDDHPRLDKVENAISYAAGITAGFALVLMVVITCVEVFSRAVFGQPLGWNVSFTERYLLVGAAFFGIVTAYRTGAHVAVTSIFGLLPPGVQKTLQIVTHAMVAVIFALLFWYGLQAALSAAATGEIPPKGATELPIPEWIWRAFIPLGSIMGMTIAVIDLYREIVAPPRMIATDYDPGDNFEEYEQ